jgi:hypothetical protein
MRRSGSLFLALIIEIYDVHDFGLIHAKIIVIWRALNESHGGAEHGEKSGFYAG